MIEILFAGTETSSGFVSDNSTDSIGLMEGEKDSGMVFSITKGALSNALPIAAETVLASPPNAFCKSTGKSITVVMAATVPMLKPKNNTFIAE